MLLKRIEIICYDQQSQGLEYVFKKYKIPYHLSLAIAEEKKLLRYTAISPDDIANTIVTELNSKVDTTQKEICLTSETIEVTISEYLKKLEVEEKEKHKQVSKKRLTEEFQAITKPSVEFKMSLLYMILISSTVAVVGMFANNGSLVIGAMLLSPLLGPLTAFSFNAAVGQPSKMLKAFIFGFILIIAIVANAAILTAISSSFVELPITQEILFRTEMSPVFLIIAVLLGIGAGIAMSSEIPGILVGVAIAAALVPPAAVTGIGLAMLDYDIFINALTLTAANVIGLILGTMSVFYILGVTPRKYFEKEKARHYIMYTIIIFSILSIILGLLTI